MELTSAFVKAFGVNCGLGYTMDSKPMYSQPSYQWNTNGTEAKRFTKIGFGAIKQVLDSDPEIQRDMKNITLDEFVEVLKASLEDYIEDNKNGGYFAMAKKKAQYGEHFADFDQWCGDMDEHHNYFNKILNEVRKRAKKKEEEKYQKDRSFRTGS